MMTALDAHSADTAEIPRIPSGSVTEDYVGLARYLAEAIELGEVSFDEATSELGTTARGDERLSLERAASTVRKTDDRSLVARLLARAQASRT
jgi:hypothetical protein